MPLKSPAAVSPLRRVEVRDYPRDLDGLAEQLRDPEPSTRRWAARDLADRPESAPLLCARLPEEADPAVRAALFSSVASIGGAAVVDGLVPLLRSEDAALRNGAIEVLAGLPKAVAPRIDALLADPDGDVRIFAVNLLGDLPHPGVPAWLARVLRTETEPNVIGAALEVLAEVGTPELAEPLRAARARFAEHPYLVFSADLVLERMEAA